MKSLNIGVVGATGVVGRELLRTLEQRGFPIGSLRLFASERSRGVQIKVSGRTWLVETLHQNAFKGLDLVFFDVDDGLAVDWVPIAASSGAFVIDNSAAFRMRDEIDIVVPEVNGSVLKQRLKSLSSKPLERVIANPNCSTSQMVMVLKPLLDRWGIERVFASTYQSTSGGGRQAQQELWSQTKSVIEGNGPGESNLFAHPIAFNCIPQIGSEREEGYTSEEVKMMSETRKILGKPSFKISATCVRVPTLNCHGEALNIALGAEFTLGEVRQALDAFPGIRVEDDLSANRYPLCDNYSETSMLAAVGRDDVLVGRIRRDPSLQNGLNLYIVADNLRKGAALNAVQIGELLVSEGVFQTSDI